MMEIDLCSNNGNDDFDEDAIEDERNYSRIQKQRSRAYSSLRKLIRDASNPFLMPDWLFVEKYR